jgi:hypothetical protein
MTCVSSCKKAKNLRGQTACISLIPRACHPAGVLETYTISNPHFILPAHLSPSFGGVGEAPSHLSSRRDLWDLHKKKRKTPYHRPPQRCLRHDWRKYLQKSKEPVSARGLHDLQLAPANRLHFISLLHLSPSFGGVGEATDEGTGELHLQRHQVPNNK